MKLLRKLANKSIHNPMIELFIYSALQNYIDNIDEVISNVPDNSIVSAKVIKDTAQDLQQTLKTYTQQTENVK